MKLAKFRYVLAEFLTSIQDHQLCNRGAYTIGKDATF